MSGHDFALFIGHVEGKRGARSLEPEHECAHGQILFVCGFSCIFGPAAAPVHRPRAMIGARLYDRLMVHLQARDIPVPTSVSQEAQAVLAMGRLGPPPKELPALDDTEGWKVYVTETDAFVRSLVGEATAGFKGSIEDRDIGPCPLYVVTPEGVGRR